MSWKFELLMKPDTEQFITEGPAWDGEYIYITQIRKKLRKKRKVDASQDNAIEQLELCLSALIRALEQKNIVTIEEVSKLVDLLDDDSGE